MTRKQMEQKIEELAAELAELRKTQAGHGCCHGATCVHWHYTTYPMNTGVSTPIKWYSTAGGNYQNFQITS